MLIWFLLEREGAAPESYGHGPAQLARATPGWSGPPLSSKGSATMGPTGCRMHAPRKNRTPVKPTGSAHKSKNYLRFSAAPTRRPAVDWGDAPSRPGTLAPTSCIGTGRSLYCCPLCSRESAGRIGPSGLQTISDPRCGRTEAPLLAEDGLPNYGSTAAHNPLGVQNETRGFRATAPRGFRRTARRPSRAAEDARTLSGLARRATALLAVETGQ